MISLPGHRLCLSLLSNVINWDREFLLEIPAWVFGSIERKPRAFNSVFVMFGNFKVFLLLSRSIINPTKARPDNIKFWLGKFSTRVLIVTNFRLHNIFPIQRQIFQAGEIWHVCVFSLQQQNTNLSTSFLTSSPLFASLPQWSHYYQLNLTVRFRTISYQPSQND